MNKICVIIPWYGKLPEYFPLFLKGLEYNKNIIDVLFITDHHSTKNLPRNLKIFQIPLEKLVEKISSSLGSEILIETPYKLCDYKPMLGKIFASEIVDYDFWGYGDIDIIYGDLSKFFSLENLNRYDIFTFREYIISGALTILKNNEYTRTLFMKSPDLGKIYSNRNYIGFDEAGKKIEKCRERIPAYKLKFIDNFTCWSSILHKEFDMGKLNLYSKYELVEVINKYTIYKYELGEFKLGLDEYVGYHFISEKKASYQRFPSWNKVPETFYIHRTGFYPKINLNFYFLSLYRILFSKMTNFYTRFINSINYRILKK